MGKGEFRRSEKKAVAALEYELRASGRETKLSTIAAKLGLSEKIEKPEIDERCNFWLNTFYLAARGRPYTYGAPLPLKPLDILDLVDQLGLPAAPEEAVAVVCAMDDAWIQWRDGAKSKNPA